MFGNEKTTDIKVIVDSDMRVKLESWFEGKSYVTEFLRLPPVSAFDKNSGSQEQNSIFESIITQGLIKCAEDKEFVFLNLLPKKIRKKIQQRQLLTNVGACLGLGILAIFCLWFNFAVMNWRLQWACHKITQEIEPIKHIAEDVEIKRQQVRAIQTQFASRQRISNLFSDL